MTEAYVKAIPGSVHSEIRASTRSAHASIDGVLSTLGLTHSDDYRMFLELHFAALESLRADWRAQDEADFAQMLQCLQLDLVALGSPTTAKPILPRPAKASFCVGLGIGYVVRGSRLGSAILRRGVPAELSTRYLDFVPTLSWVSFLLELESIANDPNGRDLATRAARSTFNTYAAEFTRLHDVSSSRSPVAQDRSTIAS